MPPSPALGSTLHCARRPLSSTAPRSIRSFVTTSQRAQETVQETATPPDIIPRYIGTKQEERILKRHGLSPVGSRRRRAAIRDSTNIPFEQLPYQCFQEARKVLAEDREEKLQQIETERKRIAAVEARDVSTFKGEHAKKGKLILMKKHLAHLIVQADINDPLIKKRFEDGLGDMERPIYRHLADKKWREQKRLVLEQRITQMYVVPDLLPVLDITADMSISFGRKTIQPGEFVDSKISEVAPTLDIQVFDRGPRLVTIVAVDADVPNTQKDGFDFRCHFMATNVELSPSKPTVVLSELPAENVALPWMPPHAQKGSPYHRLALFVLQQPEGRVIDVNALKEREVRLGFNLRSFNDRHRMQAVGATLFRTVWDDNTAGVMSRAGIEGADIGLKRKKPEKLPWQYKVKDGERYR